MRLFVASLWLLVCTSCADISHNDALFIPSDTSGSLSIALTGTDTMGRKYVLHVATFEISGTALMTLSGGAEGGKKALKTPLPAGVYQVFLRPGYLLSEEAADGSRQPVSATLASLNPAPLQIVSRADQQLSFRLQRTGEEQPCFIDFGAPSALPRAHARHVGETWAHAATAAP